MATASTKACGICGQDVAGRPRVRDPAGGYYCQPCYQRALANTHPAEAGDSDPMADLASAAGGEPRPARIPSRSTGGAAAVRSSPSAVGRPNAGLSFNAVCWLIAIVLFAIIGLCKLLFPDHGPSGNQTSEPPAVAAADSAPSPAPAVSAPAASPVPAASASPDPAPPAAEGHRGYRGDPKADRQQVHFGQPSVILMPNLTPGRLALVWCEGDDEANDARQTFDATPELLDTLLAALDAAKLEVDHPSSPPSDEDTGGRPTFSRLVESYQPGHVPVRCGLMVSVACRHGGPPFCRLTVMNEDDTPDSDAFAVNHIVTAYLSSEDLTKLTATIRGFQQ